MRVLVTWGSKRGGTAGVGQTLAAALASRGIDVVAAPAAEVRAVTGFDAAIIGGALYANRWPASVRRFVHRNTQILREIPVWFFSERAAGRFCRPHRHSATPQVAVLAERIGANGHVTFGGRLAADAKGFPASAMARKQSGDWRNPERIRAWAAELADVLPVARPGAAINHPGRSARPPARLRRRGLGAVRRDDGPVAALRGGRPRPLSSTRSPRRRSSWRWPGVTSAPAARVIRCRRRWRGQAIVALLDAVVVAGGVLHSLKMFGSIAGTWLPFALIFLATWATGELMSTMPWPTKKRDRGARAPVVWPRNSPDESGAGAGPPGCHR